MKNIMLLNDEQRDLVTQHLKLKIIEWAIYDYIQVNENLTGLEYDDLYQEGCLALCHAATTYNGKTKFQTYAQIVVKNHLISYCRGVCHTKKALSLDAPLDDETGETFYQLIGVDNEITVDSIFYQNTLNLLESTKLRYSGVSLKGIEAIELKIKGYSGKEIAEMYGVKSTYVGAWISRAAQKLRKDEMFLSAFQVV